MFQTIRYRTWQFWQSLKRGPSEPEWKQVQGLLSPAELVLFQSLPVPDQNHSLRVLNTLQVGGEEDQDLLKAALLHDIGKILHPLRRWERVFAVLIQAVFPAAATRWGAMSPVGLRRPLVVIQQHPEWGADLARTAGASQRLITLIRFHESRELTGILDQAVVELLQKLQRADNQN